MVEITFAVNRYVTLFARRLNVCILTFANEPLINEWMNKSAIILSAFKNRLRAGLVWHTMQTNPAAAVTNAQWWI